MVLARNYALAIIGGLYAASFGQRGRYRKLGGRNIVFGTGFGDDFANLSHRTSVKASVWRIKNNS